MRKPDTAYTSLNAPINWNPFSKCFSKATQGIKPCHFTVFPRIYFSPLTKIKPWSEDYIWYIFISWLLIINKNGSTKEISIQHNPCYAHRWTLLLNKRRSMETIFLHFFFVNSPVTALPPPSVTCLAKEYLKKPCSHFFFKTITHLPQSNGLLIQDLPHIFISRVKQ